MILPLGMCTSGGQAGATPFQKQAKENLRYSMTLTFSSEVEHGTD